MPSPPVGPQPVWQAPGAPLGGAADPAPQWGPPPPAGSQWGPPPPPPSVRQQTGYKVAVGIAAAVILLVLVPLMAVVFLGRSAEERFEPVGPATYDEEAGQVEDPLGNRWDVDQQGTVEEGIEELPDGWVRFTHPDGAFAVDLPSVPEAAEVVGDSPQVGAMTVGSWGTVGPGGEPIGMSWMPIEGPLAAEMALDEEQSVRNFLAGLEMSLGATLEDEVVFDVDGHETRRYAASPPAIGAGPAPAAHVVVVFGDRGVLSVIVAGSGDGTALADRIISSLEVG